MTRRRKLIAGGAVAVVAAGAAVGWWALTRPYPGWATFQRVREGMTRAEVEATVGGPPGDYQGDATVGYSRPHMIFGRADRWSTDDGMLIVDYGADGRAVSVTRYEGVNMDPPSLFARLRARLGL